MPRVRSPDSIKAEEMYHEGMLLVDIAKKIGKPEGTVRRWKSTQHWEETGSKKGKKKQTERSEKNKKSKPSVRKKQGAPKGNRNAAGHGAPIGNKNALKHGGYSEVYWDTLDEDELALIDDAPDDEETLLLQQIQLFSIRERRLMKAIAQYRDAKGGLYMSSVFRQEQKRSFKSDDDKKLYEERIAEKVKNGDRLPGEQYVIQTSTSAAIDLVARLEKELTSVQARKTKAIEALTRLRMERQKIEGEGKGNALVQAWAESVIKAREDHSDG